MNTAATNQNQQISPYKAKVDSVRGLLEKLKPQIKLALPRHMDPDRLARVALTSITKTPQLLDCTQQSLAASLLQAAQLGLEPDGLLGHGYLIPFRNNKKGVMECQFMPGYRGLMKIARQSGEISTLYARAVHDQDTFHYVCGLDEKIEHVPSLADDPGALSFVYAVAKFKDGGYQFEVMGRSQVDAIRKRSRAANDGPWITDYEAMALKTVLKRLCKFIPGSIEKDIAVGLIDRAEAGLPQDLGDVIDTTAVEEEPNAEPESALDKLVASKNAAPDKKTMRIKGADGKPIEAPMEREPGSDG